MTKLQTQDIISLICLHHTTPTIRLFIWPCMLQNLFQHFAVILSLVSVEFILVLLIESIMLLLLQLVALFLI